MGNCNCGGSGAISTCGCHSPIELITSGPTGPTGPTGATGSNGVAVLFSNIVSYDCTIGVTGQKLFTYAVDNTPTQKLPTNGDFLKITGDMAFYDTVANRACDVVLYFDTLAIAMPRVQVFPSATSYISFDLLFKKIDNSTCGIVFIVRVGVGAPFISYSTFSAPTVTSALVDFTHDFNIEVEATYVDTTTPPGADIAFTAVKNAKIYNINIVKYLQ